MGSASSSFLLSQLVLVPWSSTVDELYLLSLELRRWTQNSKTSGFVVWSWISSSSVLCLCVSLAPFCNLKFILSFLGSPVVRGCRSRFREGIFSNHRYMMTRGILKFGAVAFCYDRVLGISGISVFRYFSDLSNTKESSFFSPVLFYYVFLRWFLLTEFVKLMLNCAENTLSSLTMTVDLISGVWGCIETWAEGRQDTGALGLWVAAGSIWVSAGL